jgi:hypothetical protein
MLPELKAMRWDEPVTITAASLTQADHAQKGVQLILRILKYLPVIVVVFGLLLYWLISRWRGRRRAKQLVVAVG